MHRILIVDDEPEVAKALRRVLVRQGFEVEVSPSGADGLHRLSELEPHAVISDFRMPGMSGAEFLSEVGRRAPGAVRFLLSGCTTGTSADPAARSADELGCGLIPKPWDAGELVGQLRRALGPCGGGGPRPPEMQRPS
jgi:DNA-binding NtrC family response regulator